MRINRWKTGGVIYRQNITKYQVLLVLVVMVVKGKERDFMATK